MHVASTSTGLEGPQVRVIEWGEGREERTGRCKWSTVVVESDIFDAVPALDERLEDAMRYDRGNLLAPDLHLIEVLRVRVGGEGRITHP